MNLYSDIIKEATGEKDATVLRELEDIMRHDIFHSTLDWQTKEELTKAAKQAHEVYKELQKEE